MCDRRVLVEDVYVAGMPHPSLLGPLYRILATEFNFEVVTLRMSLCGLLLRASVVILQPLSGRVITNQVAVT